MNQHEKCHVELIDATVNQELLADAYVAELQVSGMGCPNCAARVHNALVRVGGTFAVEVSHEFASAVVVYDPHRVCCHIIEQAVADAGNDGHHHYRAHAFKMTPYKQFVSQIN